MKKKKQQHERDGKSGLPPTTAGWSIKDNHWQHTGSHKKFKPPSLPSVSSDLIISNQHEKQLQLIWWIIKQSRKELGEGENSKVEVVISLDPNDYVCFAIYQFLTYSVKYHLSSFSYLPSGDRNMAKKKRKYEQVSKYSEHVKLNLLANVSCSSWAFRLTCKSFREWEGSEDILFMRVKSTCRWIIISSGSIFYKRQWGFFNRTKPLEIRLCARVCYL